MLITASSRGGMARRAVLDSASVAQLAERAQTAPVPPQNLEAEESVLGAMMLSPGAIGAVSEILDASDFYRESHAKIYRAALGLYAKGEPVDAITLVDELEERSELEDAGSRVRIHELAALVPATANAAHYARIVREMATLRGLIRVGSEISRLGWERAGERHGRQHRRPRQGAGGDAHARDVEVRGHPAADVLRGEGRVAAAAQRQARRRRLAPPDRGMRQARQGADLRRRCGLDQHDGG